MVSRRSAALLFLSFMMAAFIAQAGAIYTNDTGQVAYGIRVEFEAPVMITSHAPVFSEMEPDGEASVFVFSGGEVPPGGTFWLSWRPADVAVAGYEWLASPQGEVVQSGEGGVQEPAGPVTPASPSGPHLREEAITATLRSEDGEEIEVAVIRRLSDRMIPFLVEYEIQGGGGFSFTWDLNHYVDSDHDGRFRNDADAMGREARAIYFSNRTPYIVTLWAQDAEGKVYRWEDEVAFNVQNGDEVLLDAGVFVSDAVSVAWEVFNGDPRDRNFRITSPTRKQTTLVSEYPGVTHVILNATDRDGNQHIYDTTLYVFNKNPDIFRVGGVRTNFWLYPNEFGYLNLALEYLREMGFNWIKIPIYWFFSVNPDGSCRIFPWENEDCDIHRNCDEVLEQVIHLLHDYGFGVELHLEIVPAPGTTGNRNKVPMNEKFFEGPDGYFAYVRHYIDIANRTGVEVFVGKTEMGCTDYYAARPWIDKLIEIMQEGLTSSEYTLENFHYPGRGIPKPWDPFYGTDLNKLELIEWSAYDKLGSYDDAPISEMIQAFKWNQLRAFTMVHSKFISLRQRIGELGIPSVNGGAVIYGAAIQPGAAPDYEEQRRAAAAILRALLDYIQDGNDFFEGWFWHSLTISSDSGRILLRNNFNLWGKPAMEEFYAFYSSHPRMLPAVPYFNNIYGLRYYIDELQDVHLPHGASRIELLQDFEGSKDYREHLGAWKVFSIPQLATGGARIVTGNAYEGNQSLEVSINTPYGRGADVAVSPRFPVGSWEDVEAVSIAIKRMDASLGAALIIPNAQNPSFSYTVRLPVSKVGEWEHFVIPISDFTTLATDGEYVGIQDKSTLSPWDIHVVFYPTEEGPLDTKVYIDSLGVVRSR